MLSPALDFVERTDTESYTDRMTAKHLKTTFAVVLLTAAGCSRPKQYRLGEAIPIGSYTMSISMTEMTHLVHQRQLVVFYRCTGAGGASVSQSEREAFLSACRSPRFRLLDGRENEYAPEEVVWAAMYRAALELKPSLFGSSAAAIITLDR